MVNVQPLTVSAILAVREFCAGWSTADQPELGSRRKSMLDKDTFADLAAVCHMRASVCEWVSTHI